MAILLETNIIAKFTSDAPITPEQQASLDALNAHAEEVTERLQSAVRVLITEMLDLKRAQYTKGG